MAKLLEYTRINNYSIYQLDNKKIGYNLIYSLESINLKILKIYTEINLVRNFIKLFKFSTSSFILFVIKKTVPSTYR